MTMNTRTHVHISGGAPTAGVIGPNAVTRLAEALRELGPEPTARAIFRRAGVERHLDNPPTRMIDERDVAALHCAMVDLLGPADAARTSTLAGRLTGDYLLANRIPRVAQAILRAAPRPIAARVLMRAIAKHAWTFAGGGAFSYAFKPRLTLTLRGSPICRYLRTEEPACQYFAATFERVLGAMLGPRVRVIETECEASGSDACRFSVTW
jgi:divinyl protochlorophyllide a 8-vinyl-reductase